MPRWRAAAVAILLGLGACTHSDSTSPNTSGVNTSGISTSGINTAGTVAQTRSAPPTGSEITRSSASQSVNDISGSCTAPTKISELVKASNTDVSSLVVGYAKLTGRTRAIDTGLTAGKYHTAYSEVVIMIGSTLHGPKLSGSVVAYVLGGVLQGVRTTTDSSGLNAFAPDGGMFGDVSPLTANELRPPMQLSALPLVDGKTVAFPDVGCWTPTGYPTHRQEVSYELISSGQAVPRSRSLATVSLADITASLS